MTPKQQDIFFSLLRLALDAEPTEISVEISENDWKEIYHQSLRQGIVGVILVGIHKLTKQQPPIEILEDWMNEGFFIHQDNILLNKMSADISRLFREQGIRTIILKGQANAHLYSDPFCRQPGDIDLLVEGNRQTTQKILKQMNLSSEDRTFTHHILLDASNFNGVNVEIHFRPINCLPLFKGKKLIRYLGKIAFDQARKYDPADFDEPSTVFALLMQLSHLRSHFIHKGIGLRQLVDYYHLLKVCSAEERKKVSGKLGQFGLIPISGAVMWIMSFVFHLDPNYLLSKPDPYWGHHLLKVALDGGNFGKHGRMVTDPLPIYWIRNRLNFLNFLRFDPAEALWREFRYWKEAIINTPKRFRQGRLSLRERIK